MMTNLKKAIEALDAVEVTPGRYAFKEAFGREWYIISQDDLALLGGGEPFSSAVCRDYAVAAPSWWSPEKRFCTGPGRQPFPSRLTAAEYGHGATIFTADLTTGEEIPVSSAEVTTP